MKELWQLFFSFCKIGAFTFGGGYAMLPLIQKEVVDKNHWASTDEVIKYFAIGQCTPGVIAVNVATFIGNQKKGIPGAIAATLGVIMPSIVIILLIATLIENFADMPIVEHAFSGIRVAVVVLIVNAVVILWKNGVKNRSGMIIFFLTLAALLFIKISAIWIILAVICGGLCVEAISRLRRKQ